jgi:hypothetical protein
MHTNDHWWLCLLLPLAACHGSARPEFDFDGALAAGRKSDMVSRAHLLGDIDLNSHVDGRFNDRVRVYGFTFEAKAGATVTIDVAATAGGQSSDTTPGAALDVVSAVYGPMDGDRPGPRVVYADGAQLAPLALASDGKYLLVFSTWNDPGLGPYTVNVGCAGTDFQCRRPLHASACNPTTRYIQGREIIATETWSQCKVVLLERTVVQKGAVLTISPGVTVQGNYLGTGDYGTVALEVDGTLQAVGTPDAPINFTALTKGWQGLVLNGPSNTLKNVFIDKAQKGVEVHGAGNTFVDLDVSVADTGLEIGAESDGNSITRVKVSQVRDGISLAGSADIVDSILLGSGCLADACAARGSGVWGRPGSKRSTFHRALISGFWQGLDLTSTELEVLDSTIVNNRRGVHITGDNAGVHPPYTCPAAPAPVTPPYRPAPPVHWGRDPVFVRTDIIKSTEYAVRIEAPELLVIEDSNVRDNAQGILVDADSLAPMSHISRSNVFNNGALQVDSRHVNGVLDISGNYWAQISDPALSASWSVTHTQALAGVCSTNYTSGCTWNGNSYLCGAYACDRNAQNCRASTTASWTGQISFTGFSPVALKAGPDTASCTEQVNQERQKQGL